jgi:hypothetical protein
VTLVLLIALAAAGFRAAVDLAPLWPYPVDASGFSPAPDDGSVKTMPGRLAAFTLSEIRH